MGRQTQTSKMKLVVCLGTLALVFVLALGEGLGSQNNYEAIESKVFDRLIRDAGRKEGQKNQKSRKGSRKKQAKEKSRKKIEAKKKERKQESQRAKQNQE